MVCPQCIGFCTVPEELRHGLDSRTLDDYTNIVLHILYASLPEPHVSAASFLSCAAAAAENCDGADRISTLPDEVLIRVVSRLPAKDGARTAVLSSRWARLWRSAPLVLADTHLLPRRGVVSAAVTDAVSAVLRAHPGPFPFVSLTCGFMEAVDADRTKLARWFMHLATKGVDELVLVNRPFLLRGLRLPSALFSCPSLRRLLLGSWEFPDTAVLPRGASFPNLLELSLGCVVMKDRDLDFVLAASPVLEFLTLLGSQDRLTARLASHSLCCAHFFVSDVTEVALSDAPCLQRLIFWNPLSIGCRGRKMETRIKILHAPQLSMLGYLEPGSHVLEIGNTIIKVGTKVSPNTIVPSVQILALHLRFRVSKEVKMLASFLRCFPGVETLCVQTEGTCEPTANLSGKFWQETSPIECIQSHLKILFFYDFHAEQRELDFLIFVAENAQALQKMYLVLGIGRMNDLVLGIGRMNAERAEMITKLKVLQSVKWASGDCKMLVKESDHVGADPFLSL